MSLKLTYFNARGGAELTRYILAYGEVKYEDERIQDTDWPAMKEKTSLGKFAHFTFKFQKQDFAKRAFSSIWLLAQDKIACGNLGVAETL